MTTEEREAAVERVMAVAEGNYWALEPAVREELTAAYEAGRASMPCYRNFNSGLGPREADGDRDDMSKFCQKAGYRACPACAARRAGT